MAVLIGGILGGQIQGRLGGNVYSTRNGKTYVRSVAKRTAPVTEAAKAQQELFSKAGIMCSHLYTAIKTSITLPSLTEMHGKIMSAMLHWLKGHPLKGDHTSFFKGCIPAKCVSLTERWCRHVQVSHKGNGVIRITIPSLIPVAEFIAPPQTASVTCRMVVAGLLAADGSLTGTSTQSVTFDYGDKKVPEVVMELSIPHREDSLIVTVMSLEFNKCYGHKHYDMSRDARYMPVGIVNAMYV